MVRFLCGWSSLESVLKISNRYSHAKERKKCTASKHPILNVQAQVTLPGSTVVLSDSSPSRSTEIQRRHYTYENLPETAIFNGWKIYGNARIGRYPCKYFSARFITVICRAYCTVEAGSRLCVLVRSVTVHSIVGYFRHRYQLPYQK